MEAPVNPVTFNRGQLHKILELPEATGHAFIKSLHVSTHYLFALLITNDHYLCTIFHLSNHQLYKQINLTNYKTNRMCLSASGNIIAVSYDKIHIIEIVSEFLIAKYTLGPKTYVSQIINVACGTDDNIFLLLYDAKSGYTIKVINHSQDLSNNAFRIRNVISNDCDGHIFKMDYDDNLFHIFKKQYFTYNYAANKSTCKKYRVPEQISIVAFDHAGNMLYLDQKDKLKISHAQPSHIANEVLPTAELTGTTFDIVIDHLGLIYLAQYKGPSRTTHIVVLK